MFPATKKYPRPNLPLLRKRNKQRDQRHMIKENNLETVSAKNVGYGYRTVQL